MSMTGPGYLVIVLWLVLSKIGNRFNIGPRWFREFKLEKTVLY
jgi:hypothetical protein